MANGSNAVDMSDIYLEIRASLTRYVSRYFKRSQEAEDVVQEAFVKVIQAQRERDIQSPKSYLFRTARNLSLAQISKSSASDLSSRSLSWNRMFFALKTVLLLSSEIRASSIT